MDTFINELRNIFQPPAESDLAHIELERLKHGACTPITTYHSAKIVTYAQAVPNPGPNNFAYLKK